MTLRAQRYVFERMNDGVRGEVRNGNFWSLVTLRKQTFCQSCDEALAAGVEAYRPLGERGATVRYERLCVACVEARTRGPA